VVGKGEDRLVKFSVEPPSKSALIDV